MFLRKKKKKFEEKEIEQIIDDYSQTTKTLIGKYLPRRARRAMNKGKGSRLTSAEKSDQIQKIKKIGISTWLNETTEDTFGELSSFVTDPISLQAELQTMLKEFKKKWNIK